MAATGRGERHPWVDSALRRAPAALPARHPATGNLGLQEPKRLPLVVVVAVRGVPLGPDHHRAHASVDKIDGTPRELVALGPGGLTANRAGSTGVKELVSVIHYEMARSF